VGYEVSLVNSNFRFKVSKCAKAYGKLKALQESQNETQRIAWSIPLPADLPAVFTDNGYNVEKRGGYWVVTSREGKWRYDERMWEALAEFVEDGRFLHFVGEDGEHFLIVFHGGKTRHFDGEIIFSGSEKMLADLKEDEFTAAETERQHCVDSAIFNLIQDIVPSYGQVSDWDDLWDMSIIGEIRDEIFEWLKEKKVLTDDDEQAFYPFREVEDGETPNG